MRKILIVDDEEINRKILGRILQNEYEPYYAANGLEAMKVLHEHSDELSAVLLDIIMPIMDGYEVLCEIRNTPKYTGIPVIVTTGGNETGAEVKALTLGANDYIVKPYNPEIIKHRLANTIKLRESAALVNAIRTDALTGLYSRSAFFEKASEMILQKEAGYYVLSSFDIDNFKVINDQYGTSKGDEVLRYIAKRFNECFTTVGGICARMNADHFAMIYPAAYVDDNLLSELRRSISELDGSIQPISFNIGRCMVTDIGLSPSALYDRATMAASLIKGKFDQNVSVYDESMRHRILQEQEITGEMNAALNGNQFEVWYQPQYNHSNGAVIGVEALVRWRHPQKGIISPALFIPVFERNGFIYELDKFVWEQVCKSLRKWIDSGIKALPVSVNISRYDIFRDDFMQTITRLVKDYSITPDMLRLEITESAFAKDTKLIVDVVRKLIDYGFTLEIDDFGSGYSSFNTLKDVPADVLKIDMRFLEGNENSTRGGNILESIVRMTKWLGMAVVAEGVETIEQADYLKSIGCNYIQGYLYARPMTCADYEELLKKSEKEPHLNTLKTLRTLDNDTFWNPNSMETLIFNSYVGGACILEAHNDRIEVLRVNEKYAQELYGEMTIEEAISVRISDYLDSTDKKLFINCIKTAISSRDEKECEVCLRGLGAKNAVAYLRITVRDIARTNDRYLLYGTVINITEKKLSEIKEKNSIEQLKFLNETSKGLLAGNDTHEAINEALSKILGYFGGDRSYVIEIDDSYDTMSNTFEVCAEGISSRIYEKQKTPICAFESWFEVFKTKNHISVKAVQNINSARYAEKARLLAGGIHSLIAVPLRREGEIIGIMGVDNPTRRQNNVGNLEALGDYMTVILTRRDLNAQIKRDNETLSYMTNDMLGGFVQLKIDDYNNYTVNYANVGLYRILGYDDVGNRDELYKNIHPDDLPLIKHNLRLLRKNGDRQSFMLRLLNSQGKYVNLLAFCGVSTIENGNRIIGIHFTEQIEIEKTAISVQNEIPKKHELNIGADLERAGMLTALRSVYPLGMSVDITANTIRFIYGTEFVPKSVVNETAYNKFIVAASSCIPDEYKSAFIEAFSTQTLALKLCERKSGFSMQYTQKLPGKKLSWYETVALRVENVYSDHILCILFTRNIDEQKKNEEHLKISLETTSGELSEKQKYMQALDSFMPGCTIVLDFDNKKILHAGGTLLREFAYTESELDELESNGLRSLVIPEDYGTRFVDICSQSEKKPSFEQEYRVRCKNGEIVWIYEKGTLVNAFSDKPVYIIVCLDVTRRKKIEEKLRVNELELVKANERILEMVAQHSNRLVYRYDVKKSIMQTYNTDQRDNAITYTENLPESLIENNTVFPESIEDFRKMFADIHSGVAEGSAKLHINNKKGRAVWVDTRFSVIFSDTGKPDTAVISLLDITNTHEKELAYERYRQTVGRESVADGKLIYLEADVTSDITEKFGGTLIPLEFPEVGVSRTDMINFISSRYIVPSEREQCREFFSREHLITSYSDGVRTLESDWSINYDSGGQHHYIHAEVSLVLDPYSGHIKSYTILRDVTQQRKAELDIRKKAETDGMTGLLNKTMTEALIRRRLDSKTTVYCALIIIDLDNLKGINDNYGHNSGDEAIINIARIIRETLSARGIAGRIGGDEFLVYIEGSGNETLLRELITKFQTTLSSLKVGGKNGVFIHGSIGVAVGMTGRDMTYEELFAKADKALYYVKRHGKNNYAVYSPQIEENAENSGSNDAIWHLGSYDNTQIDLLLAALAKVYPLVISINLTKNSFLLMQYEGYHTRIEPKTRRYDELLSTVALTFAECDRQELTETLSLSNLLSKQKQGVQSIAYVGKQLGDDGVYHTVQTEAVFINNNSAETDAVIFVREIKERENI